MTSTMDRTLDLIQRVPIPEFLKREPWWAEFFAACGALGWVWISINANEGMAARGAFEDLVALRGEHFWEWSGAILAAAQIIALITNHRWSRWAIAVCFCYWWSVLAVGITAADGDARSAALYYSNAALHAFCIIRLPKYFP